mgnify:CR=1 FL=1
MYFFPLISSYWVGKDGPSYKGNVRDGMQFLWDKHKSSVLKPLPKDKMPWSGYDYVADAMADYLAEQLKDPLVVIQNLDELKKAKVIFYKIDTNEGLIFYLMNFLVKFC